MPRSSAGSQKRQGPHHHPPHASPTGLVPPATPRRPQNRTRSSSSAVTLAQQSAQAAPAADAAQEVSTAATQFHVGGNGTATATETVNGNGWDGKGSGSRYQECIEMADEAYEGRGEEQRKIDFNPGCKSASADASATVLPSFPLLDTITLLIIFLQLPSTVLTIIHFLFATQTFIGPNTTLLSASTPYSLPSFTNLLLQGSNGTPSLLTIIFADVVVAAISMFLWPSARSFLIEFAQAVIAISLGAGSSSHNGGSLRNAAVCAGVMGGVKVVQGRFRLSDAWDSIQPMTTSAETPIQGVMEGRGGHPATWIRSAIAIHIVANGAMRATRSWLIHRAEESDASSSESTNAKDGSTSAKQKDPEAAAGVPTQPPERDSITSGKRKKKNQIQSVKDKQPLWGTIANAIVHVTKQIEQSRVSSEAVNSPAEESGSSSTEPLTSPEDGVWITKIGSTDVSFVVNVSGSGEDEERIGTAGNGVDKNSPFFVRVNGIRWPQTDIYRTSGGESDTEETNDSDGERHARSGEDGWAVHITGLTGATEYDFEFVRSKDGVFYRTSACTVPAQASTRTTPAKHQPPRPMSPVTTLLHSLAQANSQLHESKAALKAAKKAHKSGLSDIRKEIEKHRGLLDKDRGEERAYRRNLSLKDHIKRAEEEAESMQRELDRLRNVPDKIKPQWKEKQRQWLEEKRKLEAAQDRAAQDKAAADSRATSVESDAAALATKKEKLVARLNKLHADIDKLDRENAEVSNAMTTKAIEREYMQRQRKKQEQEFMKAIFTTETMTADFQHATSDHWTTYYAFQEAVLQQQQAQLPPSTPDHGKTPASSSAVLAGTGMAGLAGMTDMAHASDLAARGRSYSTFSDESVLTNPSEMESSEFYQSFAKLGGKNLPLGCGSNPSMASLAGMLERKASD